MRLSSLLRQEAAEERLLRGRRRASASPLPPNPSGKPWQENAAGHGVQTRLPAAFAVYAAVFVSLPLTCNYPAPELAE